MREPTFQPDLAGAVDLGHKPSIAPVLRATTYPGDGRVGATPLDPEVIAGGFDIDDGR